MGKQDFDAVFCQLDSQQRGYVTAKQIQLFHSTICDVYTDEEIVLASISRICGEGSVKVVQDSFLDVLDEIDRRITVDSEAYWDFQALDCNGDHHISLTDALLLFQEYHADLFSLDTWHQFLQSRDKPDADVYFDEIRDWLCDVPKDSNPSKYRDVKKEEARLDQVKEDAGYRDLEEMRNLMKNEDLDKEEEEKRRDEIQDEAKRKLNKWKTHGLSALLHDDGLGEADSDDTRVASHDRDSIRTSDVIDALDLKYSSLQDKVVMEMASFAANMDSEKLEIFQQLKRSLAKLIKDKTISDKVDELPGSKVVLPMTLLGMMGDLDEAEAGRKEEFDSLRSALEAEGKSETEVDAALAMKYKEMVEGQSLCGKVLIQLHNRHKAERDVIMNSLQNNKSSVPSTTLLALFYWRLLRQLRLLQEEPLITPAGLAVGLGERIQKYKPKRFDWDRERSETLAKLRLEARKGHKPVKRSTAAPDLDGVKRLNAISLKVRLVEEMEQKHYLEREAMIYLMQGHDSKTSLEAAARMSSEERQHRIRTLRNQREEWKSVTNPDLAVNYKLLQEAVGLYCEERRIDLEAKNHNMGEIVVLASVLADLQQRQEVEFTQMINEIHSKSNANVTEAVFAEIEAVKDEHFNNIACVTLGCVEISSADAEYVKALESKYKALRDQIFVFGLIEKTGSAWKSLSKEEKQKEILKQRKEEKKLRSAGHLGQMSSMIGPRSMALESLTALVGEDKVFGNVPTRQVSTSINLLADLVPRFDHEQDSLLSWLHSEEAKSLLSKSKHVQITRMAAEKFAVSAEGDHETALLFVGLLERINSSLSGRSKADRDKQLLLAQKRAALRQKWLKHGDKLRSPPEEKIQPKGEDDRTSQAILMRAMLRRHYKERDIMLSLLQDEGLDELVEAAVLMSPDQAVKRIQELKEKREAMDLDDKENEEEHAFILEEAGAIRAGGMKQAMCKTMGRAVLLDEVVAHLLKELQELQDIELATILQQLPSMNAQDMLAKIGEEEIAKKNSHCHLVMKVFCKFDGDTSTEDFDKLIQEKYSELRNQLMTESLSQQHGKQAWAKMGQKQRKKLLGVFAAKEAGLWNEGSTEAMSACLAPSFSLETNFPYLSGMGRQQYAALVFSAEGSYIEEEDTNTASQPGGQETICLLYQRFVAEGDFVKNYLTGSLDTVPSDDDKQLLQNKLKWEINLCKSVPDFMSASLIAGLAERQNSDKTLRLQNDRLRYELLAKNLIGNKGEQVKKSGLEVILSSDISKQQEAVLSLLLKKHLDEWNHLCQMMASSKFKEISQITSLETQQQIEDRLSELLRLRNQFDFTGVSQHLTILEEAVTVKKESRRHELGSENVNDDDVMVSLMADLLEAQLCEAQIYMEAFVVESKEDLQDSQKNIITEISQTHLINIAEIVFSGAGTGGQAGTDGEEENLKKAVDGKYDALRDQLLIQALIDEMGEAEWRRLSEQERQRRLLELKLKERQLRKEGKYDEAASLIGEMLNNDEKIRKILGDARDEQERKLGERLERRKQRLAEGMSEEECEELEQQEIAEDEEEERQRKKNILLYLDHCHDKEKEDLLKRLKEIEDERERQRQRQIEMLKLRREQRRLRDEDKFDSAALLMSLSEENDKKAKLSKEEEKNRQQELARQRLEMARLRRMQGESLVRGESIILAGEVEEDGSKIGEMVLRLVDKRHQKERELLIKLLDEGSEGDARDEARVMTDDDIKSKLEDIQNLYNLWKDSGTSEKEDGEKILADATVLCIEAKKRDMQAEGELGSDEDVKVALVADLQMIQDGEASQMLLMLTDVDEERKKAILQSQKQMAEKDRHSNVATVLLCAANEEDIFSEEKKDGDEKSEEEKEEEKVVEALEKKYDSMRDKLLMEALMREMGEAEWARLTELERQRKLIELKKEEKRLRKQGKMDDVAALLGQFMDDSKEIDRLLGQTEEDQKRRIQEKLALRKKLKEEREAAGLSVDENTLDEIVEEEDKKNKRKNILENLDSQFEEEKAALLAALRGQNDHFLREKERQLALAKLQREQRRLQQEENFDSAAMIFALGQEGSERKQQNLLNERERQRQLAKDRLEAMKKRRAEGREIEVPDLKEEEEGATSLAITDEVVFLQDSILAGVEKHQADERDTYMALLSKYGRNKETVKQLSEALDNDLRLGLTMLQRDYESWKKQVTKSIADVNNSKMSQKKKLKLQAEIQQRHKTQLDILEQMLAHKFELERRQLVIQHPEMTDEEILDELSICGLADLQQKQLAHLISVQDSIRDETSDKLKEIRKIQKAVNREGWFKSLLTALISVSDMVGELHNKEDLQGKLEKDFQKQKNELLERGQRESIDVDAMLKDLESQFENRKKVLSSDIERQREQLKQRLAEKKQAVEDKEWNAASLAGQIFATGEANVMAMKQAKEGERGRQDNLLQQRLQERREARKKAHVTWSRESTFSSQPDQTSSRRGTMDGQSPVFGLSRERTSLSIDVSDDQKQAMYDQLVKQQLMRQEKISAQLSRQEKLLKSKLDARSTKRENEVAALVSLGERQKTILEQTRKDERERQIAHMQERVTRMRESRSRSPAKGSGKEKKK